MKPLTKSHVIFIEMGGGKSQNTKIYVTQKKPRENSLKRKEQQWGLQASWIQNR